MTYDLTLKPNNRKLIMLTAICAVMVAAGIIGCIVAAIYWDDYVIQYKVKKILSGEIRTRTKGWPYTLQSVSLYLLAIGGVAATINIVNMIRVKTAFAVNNNGMMLTLKGLVKPVFVEWNDIESLQEINNKYGRGVVVRFRSIDALIERYGGKRKKYISRAPVTINATTAKGDIDGFVAKLLANYKNQ
jgi:hypothetical protein